MKKSKVCADLVALQQLALEDLDASRDADLRTELAADGVDMDVLGMSVRASVQEAVACEMRQRLRVARERLAQHASAPARPRVLPAISQLKALVQQAFDTEPALGLAFREGKRQSDSDWQSLYEDLIELGAIVPEGDFD